MTNISKVFTWKGYCSVLKHQSKSQLQLKGRTPGEGLLVEDCDTETPNPVPNVTEEWQLRKVIEDEESRWLQPGGRTNTQECRRLRSRLGYDQDYDKCDRTVVSLSMVTLTKVLWRRRSLRFSNMSDETYRERGSIGSRKPTFSQTTFYRGKRKGHWV